MPSLRTIVVLLVAAALGLPAAAAGQATQTVPGSGSAGSTPPVQLGGGDGRSSANTDHTSSRTSGSKARDSLPNTGSDPRLLFAAGAALMLLGVGLRLRTADAELY